MAVLWVKNGFQKEFERKINSYTSKLSDIDGQYSSASQLISGYSGDSNVSTCNVYLKKRRSAIQTAIDSAKTLKQAADKYVSSVVSADTTISKSIHTESYSFYKKKGIGPQKDTWYARAWNSVTTTVSDFVHDAVATKDRIIADIKEFYEEYKYIFNVLGDILAVAGAIALFTFASLSGVGLIILIGATWALSKALYETVTDCMAVDAWSKGDTGRAEDLANRTLTNDMIQFGEFLDEKLGTDFMKSVFKGLTIALNVCELFATVATIFLAIEKVLNLDSLKSLDIRNLTHRSFKQSLYYGRGIPKRIINAFLSDPAGVIKGLYKQGGKLIGAGEALGSTIADIIMR